MRARNWLTAPCVGLALALGGCATTDASAPSTGVATQASAAQAAWPHQASNLAPDENVRFGVLPNGMRYAIMRNATPAGAGSLRLRIDAGSLNEAEDQRGVAHFIEHLALNETRNVPEGELVRILERNGLRFGPDTNALTTFEQTVFMLDLPRTDAQTVDTGLFLMREVAGEATFSQRAIDNERGIILSEERTRATPLFRMAVDELGYLYGEDLLPRRMPIGSTDVIRNVTRDRIVAFYDGYYRPERATLIAVGDFDVAEMETKIRTRFGDWRGRGTPAPDPAAPTVPTRDMQTRVFVEPGVPTRASMNWLAPLNTDPDTRERRIQQIREDLGIQILNRRIERLAAGQNPPLIGGALIRHRVGMRAEVLQFVGVTQAGQWNAGLRTLEQEHRRVVEHGFTEAELNREISETRSRLTAAAAGAATRPSPQLAMGIVNAVNEDQVVVSPATQLELFNAAVEGLTPQQVSEATRRLVTAGAPLVYLTSPVAVEGGEAAVRTAFNQSRQTPVAAPAVQQARTWPYESFGTPGQVAERTELQGLGATAVRFANGVRLTVKPTQFRTGEVLVSARFGRGVLGTATDRPSPVWGYQLGAFVAGGVGRLTHEELQQVLASTVYAVNAGIDEDAFTLSGTTRPQDFARQMQVLAAYISDPAWASSGWDRIRAYSGTIHDQLESAPGGILGRDLETMIRSGDRRWATPSREEMTASTIADLRSALAQDMASGPLEVVVVGDISVDEAIRQTAATFGAMPPRRPANAAAPAPVRFAAGQTVNRTHGGRADQGLAYIAWPTAGFYQDPRRAFGLNLLAQVFQLRLNEEIRERQGAAYSPTAANNASDAIRDYGVFAAYIETPPANLEGFMRDAQAIARSLREQPIQADELQRARRPFLETLQRNLNSNNQFWLSRLGGVQQHPERAESLRTMVAQYGAITPAELQQLARQYLNDERAFRMFIRPRG